MTSPFGKNCPWKGCQQKITRCTGDPDSESFSVRCDTNHANEHRSHATRAANGRLTLTPDPEGESLESL